MKRKIYLALIIVFILVFIGSAIGVANTLYRYRQADELYNDLQYQYVISSPHESDKSSDGISEDQSEIESEPEIEPEYPPITVDFDSLLQENGDVVGWLYCEDTPINYPVVQSKDNEDYLHSDLRGRYLYAGTLFADYRCGAVGTDRNHIIYGHNMNNGSMFGTIVKYKEQSYFDKYSVLYYLTPEKDYKIQLFSGLVTKSDSDVYYPYSDETDDYEAFLQNIIENSTFTSDVTVTKDDCIVTLSTCSYEFNDARYVVVGKLTPIN